MAPACVVDSARTVSCRDTNAATHLKLMSMFVIFLTSILGICSPVLLARYFQGKPMYEKAILLIKCFAAGVILSTSLVHVLPDAYDAMLDCHVASMHPWRDFPFAGAVSLLGALLALFVDITATAHVEGGPGHGHGRGGGYEVLEKIEMGESGNGLDLGKVGSDGDSNIRQIRHCHDGGEYDGLDLRRVETHWDSNSTPAVLETSPLPVVQDSSVDLVKLKQRLVSQVLEIGIIFHSVIIGVTMGMSQNKCTIRPLVAALAFHQIFEGMGLGGCIAQAGFGSGTIAYMCFMFSVTTPMGIVVGMIVFSLTGYDDSNPNALIMEGLLGSLSSGILIYMGLVDLIAVDFFHNKLMSSTHWLKKASFVALVLGSTSMSILALWA